MAAYGLQRGIKGSEAQHISTHEYYRSLIAQGEDLQANISQLLEEQGKARLVIAEAEQAKKDLARIKAEAKTEELKNSATRTATSVLNGMNSLLGGNKVSRLEKENAQLHREVEDLNGQIERLHTDMQKMKGNHARELNRTNEQHQLEMSNLKRLLDKTYRWFPSFKRFSIWNVSVCNTVSTRNRPTNSYTGRPSIIVACCILMSTGAMSLLIMLRHR